ncbi:MAG TPA: outer membrane protein transport protein, partial [Polyangiales bacterium]
MSLRSSLPRRASRGLSCALLACALFVLSQPPRAHAGGFENARFGSERGHAVTPTPLAVYYNPAALSATRKVHIAIDGVLALHGQQYTRSESTVPEPADAQGANLGRAKSLDVLGAPTLAASVKLGDFALGAGLFVPFGGFVGWQGNDAFKGNMKYPGAQDGRARWHAIDASTAFLYLSAGASYQIRPIRLSLGVGINAIYGAASLARAQTAARDDDVSAEGRSLIDVSGWMASFSAGLMWEAIEHKLWIGASYQAPPGFYSEMTLRGEVRTRTGGATSEVAAD